MKLQLFLLSSWLMPWIDPAGNWNDAPFGVPSLSQFTVESEEPRVYSASPYTMTIYVPRAIDEKFIMPPSEAKDWTLHIIPPRNDSPKTR